MDTLFVVNRQTTVPESEVAAAIPAFQAQITQDFGPIYNVEASLEFVSKRQPVPAGAWPIYLLENSNVPGAAGYHQDVNGKISGLVFTETDAKAGISWTVDFTHEMMEMLADPTTNDLISLQGRWAGYQCLRECCDAVESDEYAYQKPGSGGVNILVSDFCLPNYFYEGTSGSPFDFRGHLTAGAAPTLLPGGYLGIYNPATGQWSQVSDFERSGLLSFRSRRFGRTAVRARGARR
jgi:hypothetical protein